jgi:hypothetical protein
MKSDFEKDLEIKESFDAMLDECYPNVKIGYSTFTASEILFVAIPLLIALDYLNTKII